MISAVIVAGGRGKRLDAGISKQYIKLGDREILAWTLDTFEGMDEIDEIILVVPQDEMDYCREKIVAAYGYKKVGKLVEGGTERQNSVYNGLMACSPETGIVLIHDGARPFVSREIIERSIAGAMRDGACAVAVPVKDTLKVLDSEGYVESTPDRSKFFAVQTPQAFHYRLIVDAHRKALKESISATDDTMLVEALGGRVRLVAGDYFNIKVTTREDLIFGEAILKQNGNA